VVRFDAASATLTVSQPAQATALSAGLSVGVPEKGVRIGPLPAGTPVNLLAALEVAPERSDILMHIRHDADLVSLLLAVKSDGKRLGKAKTDAERAQIQDHLDEQLYARSKCPDYVVNSGHYFGTSLLGEEPGLSDADKEALIAFLKRL
jgi:hypothetical protein